MFLDSYRKEKDGLLQKQLLREEQKIATCRSGCSQVAFVTYKSEIICGSAFIVCSSLGSNTLSLLNIGKVHFSIFYEIIKNKLLVHRL